jgi:membrane protein YdbS with pleckstrin-like domain
MATCPQCGVEVMEGAMFCHKCGASMNTAAGNPPEMAMSPADARAEGRPTAAESFHAARSARQNDDRDDVEQDLWEGDYSAKAMTGLWILAGIITIAVIVAGFLFTFTGTGWLIAAGLIAAMWIVIFLVLLYKQHSVHYRLTDQRFIHERGLLSRVTDRIEVIDMDDITFRQGLIERMLNVGTITITSSDKTHPEIKLPGIDDVRNVATRMDDARRRERRRRGLHIEAV